MGAPLRVVHLGKYYPPARGGIETHLENLAQGQAALGHDVRVVVVNHARADADLTWSPLGRTDTVEERDGPVRVTRVARVANVARLDLCPPLPGLLRDIAVAGVDLVHLHLPNATMMLALAALPPEVPLVITHHSDIIRQRIAGRAVRPLEERLFRRARRVLCTSPRYPQGSRLLQAFAAKVVPVPLGLALDPYLEPSPAALREAEDLRARFPAPRWLCVGRLVYYKGLHVALRALRSVPGTLLVVGGGPRGEALRRQAAELGVAGRVAWLGELAPHALVGAYRAATALWFPSCARAEGFGLVQVEAMASACPVINADIPGSGVPWVSPHEETGLTVPPRDAGALARAATRLVAEPELRERLGRAGRARARAEFGRARMAERTLACYREALSG